MNYQRGKLIIITLMFILMFPAFVGAKGESEIGFSVEPAILQFEVLRGAEIQKVIRIKNTGNAPVPTAINLRDLSFGYLDIKERGRIALADWIQIKNFYFILNPGEIKEVPLYIAVPESAEYRTYWSLFTVEPQLADSREKDVRTVAMVGIPLLLAVVPEGGRLALDGGLIIEEMGPLTATRLRHLEKFVNRILDIKTTLAGKPSSGGEGMLIVEKDPYDFNIKLKNTGNYHYYARGAIGLYDGNNKLVASADVDTKTILPGEEKDYPLRMNLENSAMLMGKYHAAINLLAYGGGGADAGQKVEKTVKFWIFPWKKILFASLFALLFFPGIFTLFFYRKRFISAARILFGGNNLLAAEYKVKKEMGEIKNLYVLKHKSAILPPTNGKMADKQRSAIPKIVFGG